LPPELFPLGSLNSKAVRLRAPFCSWNLFYYLGSVYNQGEQAMTDKTAHIGAIVEIMLNTWDLPADCNEGELFTYAETLYDRIIAGDSKEDLYAYLSEVQVDHLEMAKSDAFKAIVDRAVERS
jgi:hypothetical protein